MNITEVKNMFPLTLPVTAEIIAEASPDKFFKCQGALTLKSMSIFIRPCWGSKTGSTCFIDNDGNHYSLDLTTTISMPSITEPQDVIFHLEEVRRIN